MSDTSQGTGWWKAADGKWYPPRMTAMQITAPEPFVLTIGDIGVSRSWVVTPQGNVPIDQAQISAIDQTITIQKTPGWAVAMAVIFIWVFLLSLLFLLVKENQTKGTVMVTVTGPGVHHVVFVPAYTAQQAMIAKRDVDHTNALIQRARL